MNRLSLRNNWLKFKTSRKITHHFRGIYRIYLSLVKKNQKITTCNRLDLETLGSFFSLSMLKILPKTLLCPIIKSHNRMFESPTPPRWTFLVWLLVLIKHLCLSGVWFCVALRGAFIVKTRDHVRAWYDREINTSIYKITLPPSPPS